MASSWGFQGRPLRNSAECYENSGSSGSDLPLPAGQRGYMTRPAETQAEVTAAAAQQGWYTGYDGNYHYREPIPMPAPPPLPAAAAVPGPDKGKGKGEGKNPPFFVGAFTPSSAHEDSLGDGNPDRFYPHRVQDVRDRPLGAQTSYNPPPLPAAVVAPGPDKGRGKGEGNNPPIIAGALAHLAAESDPSTRTLTAVIRYDDFGPDDQWHHEGTKWVRLAAARLRRPRLSRFTEEQLFVAASGDLDRRGRPRFVTHMADGAIWITCPTRDIRRGRRQ